MANAQAIFKALEKGEGVKRAISLFPTSVNLKNQAGSTPLHIAASAGQVAFVRELLNHGAPHDVVDAGGNVPLHLAAELGALDCVTELLSTSARKLVVKAKNREGQTPLHLAVRNGHTAVAAKLIDAGARAEAKDKADHTPLDLCPQDNEELLQLLLNVTSTAAAGNTSMGLGGAGVRASVADGSGLKPPAPSLGPAASPAPLRQPKLEGTPGTARPPPLVQSPSLRGAQAGPPVQTPHGRMSMPRITGVAPSPRDAGAGGGAGGGGAGAGTPMVGPTVAAQLQKHDGAIQALQGEMVTALDRLSTVDACAAAQLDAASQMAAVLASSTAHSQLLSELEERVGFQEERGKETRTRLERLEEGERDVKDTMARLTADQRSLAAQLREQASSTGGAVAAATAAEASHSQQLHLELAQMRVQVESVGPALGLATTASAEVRALGARLDAVQQQVHHSAAQQAVGTSSAVVEQQVVQLQAQVQLLQLPVATVSQQCADLSMRMGGFAEWQQQARAELARLAEAASKAGSSSSGGGAVAAGEMSEAVMRVLETTAKTMAELKQQQDATAKQVAALLAAQQQGTPSSSPPPSSTPPVPGTPNGPSQRNSSAGGEPGQLGGPPSRNLHAVASMGKDTAAAAEMRAELDALKAMMADVRKDVASEGGSIRREWQRAFSDMQTRYGEQANELRAREANIAKLREATLVEEAERRAAQDYEAKVAARLNKLETSIEYLTHRLEVAEEQVTGMASALSGGMSPSSAVHAGRVAQATPRGPGPVAEDSCSFGTPATHLTIAAAAASSAATSLAATPMGQEKFWAAVGEVAAAGPVASGAGACKGPLFGAGATDGHHEERWWQEASPGRSQPAAPIPRLTEITGAADAGQPPGVSTSSAYKAQALQMASSLAQARRQSRPACSPSPGQAQHWQQGTPQRSVLRAGEGQPLGSSWHHAASPHGAGPSASPSLQALASPGHLPTACAGAGQGVSAGMGLSPAMQQQLALAELQLKQAQLLEVQLQGIKHGALTHTPGRKDDSTSKPAAADGARPAAQPVCLPCAMQ
ncbi:hypothetical protein HYH03_000164 [Edaphochlamys debaryana]|uniref:Uncharacterized protein n=1 Tax=Edaphochlamys debaryana TaxID=47281 RepID=A0A835YFM2_9CHLO|nr:hypothetical protein HYH03_000164 [Edaphochlamys debaryana]|eukprot:KAG2501661.1 hypothetical protein HYH03_000164 [Edaphochlamys debaryana]